MSQKASHEKLPLGRCLELLADQKRRLIVRHFMEQEDSRATVEEVASALIDATKIADNRRKRRTLKTSLVHSHLAKLADAGVLEFNHHRSKIRYHGDPRLEELSILLQDVE